MGIGPTFLYQMVELSARFRPEGRSVMFGRQKLRRVPRLHRPRLNAALSQYRPGTRLDDLYQTDGYAEKMFHKLGFQGIEILDASPYERSDAANFVQHDLNDPVPAKLKGAFDFIYDGGTLEHVFNVPMALTNVFNMLRPGGRVVGLNPLNGYPEHGMYQFTAELVYGFWKRVAGCRVVGCRAISQTPGWYAHDIADPQDTGRRTSYRTALWPFSSIPPGRILLQYEVEKLPQSRLTGAAIQPDYAVAWAETGQGL